MKPVSIIRRSLAAAGAVAIVSSAAAVPITIGSVTFDTDNSVTAASAMTTGVISFSTFNAPIQGVGNPAVDDANHIGTLLGGSGGFAVDLTNGTSGGAGRVTVELTWGAGLAAVNGSGDDLFVVESGTFTDPTGFPEAFAVAVREEGGAFGNYRYEFFETGDAGTLKLVTAFDFSDFGLASGARVDAVRIINLHNASSASEDRALLASGAGEIALGVGNGTGFEITQGPLGGNGNVAYPDSAMDADIVYVAARQVELLTSDVSNWTLYE